MIARNKILIALLIILGLGIGLGYFFGYDHGFEKSAPIDMPSVCEQEAEIKAREDLKAKYGDVLDKDFVLGSPHYKEHYESCLKS